MPWISETFTKEYLEGDDPRYAVLRYTYENLFIMKIGYSFTYNSLKKKTAATLNRTNGYQGKFNIQHSTFNIQKNESEHLENDSADSHQHSDRYRYYARSNELHGIKKGNYECGSRTG